VTVGSILRDAAAVYRLLFRRSVVTAAIVYAVITVADVVADQPDIRARRTILGLVAFALAVAGPVLVQGALVRIVRNIHEGERPEEVGTLFRAARDRIGSLLLASIVYGLGVLFGLLLLVVPGLLAAARWCLMAPLIMLEGKSSGDARSRSASIVRGQTGTVLIAIIVSFLLTSSLPWATLLAATLLAGSPDAGSPLDAILFFVWSSVTAPFSAHVLTVIYYKLVDPDRPIIHESVAGWESPWTRPAPERAP
jgi:hypothetical protein